MDVSRQIAELFSSNEHPKCLEFAFSRNGHPMPYRLLARPSLTLIATDMIADQKPDAANRLRRARVGTVDEVAAAVIMVVGNAYMTGQTVLLNGGRAFL